MQTTKGVQSELATAGTGFGVSAVLPSLSSSPSLLLILIKRFIHGEAWLIPSETETPCALALVSARQELVGEPPGLVEGAVGGEPLHSEHVGVSALREGASVAAMAVVVLLAVTQLQCEVVAIILDISFRFNLLKSPGHLISVGLKIGIVEGGAESTDVGSPWRHLAAVCSNTTHRYWGRSVGGSRS